MSKTPQTSRVRVVGLSVILMAGAALVGSLMAPAGATHKPADKVSAAGSTAEVVAPGQSVTLLSETIRTAAPTDLILGVTAECVLTTELTTVGNDSQTAEAKVRIWVEIDGVTVPVSSDDAVEPGKVTFCDRFDQRETTLFDDEDATIRTLHRSGSANAFNWLALDTGNGIHTIEVKADLTTAATDNADAMAAVGKRTLIIEPTKAAHDEKVTAVD